MKKTQLERYPIFLLFFIAVVSTFLLAIIWEFLIEEKFMNLLGEIEKETSEDHWRYVFSVTIFAALALIIPTWLLRRSEKQKLSIFDELKQNAEVLEHTVDGVMIADKYKNIVSVNPAFTEITGYQVDEVIGKNPRFLKSDHHDSAFYLNIWDSVNKNGEWKGEIWNRKKNGEAVPLWESICEIKNNLGDATHYVAIFSDISVIKKSEEDLIYLANHDALTKLPNRTLFHELLNHAILHAKREGESVTVMFIDLDRFKQINDSLGHRAGDLLLQEVAERLKACLREGDTVCRHGGDEFLVLVGESSNKQSNSSIVARKILDSLAQPFDINQQALTISASIGISSYPINGNTSEVLIQHADTAMYRAKDQGRNNYRIYTQDLSVKIKQRLDLEMDLRQAISSDQLFNHYQPQFSLSSHRLIGMETLLRWSHPVRGMISPCDFISVAEDAGLIIPLTESMIEKAISEWVQMTDGLPHIPRLGVNISAHHFRKPGLVFFIQKLLRDYRLKPELLELEITESALMHNTEMAIEIINELKTLGLRIAIDDFGTGYSSLSYLRLFPIDTVKIDRSFINELIHNTEVSSLVSAIIRLCHILGMEVVAEGVETTAQMAMLEEQGCDIIQGYLFSRPISKEELKTLLHSKILPKKIELPDIQNERIAN